MNASKQIKSLLAILLLTVSTVSHAQSADARTEAFKADLYKQAERPTELADFIPHSLWLCEDNSYFRFFNNAVATTSKFNRFEFNSEGLKATEATQVAADGKGTIGHRVMEIKLATNTHQPMIVAKMLAGKGTIGTYMTCTNETLKEKEPRMAFVSSVWDAISGWASGEKAKPKAGPEPVKTPPMTFWNLEGKQLTESEVE